MEKVIELSMDLTREQALAMAKPSKWTWCPLDVLRDIVLIDRVAVGDRSKSIEVEPLAARADCPMVAGTYSGTMRWQIGLSFRSTGEAGCPDRDMDGHDHANWMWTLERVVV